MDNELFLNGEIERLREREFQIQKHTIALASRVQALESKVESLRERSESQEALIAILRNQKRDQQENINGFSAENAQLRHELWLSRHQQGGLPLLVPPGTEPQTLRNGNRWRMVLNPLGDIVLEVTMESATFEETVGVALDGLGERNIFYGITPGEGEPRP